MKSGIYHELMKNISDLQNALKESVCIVITDYRGLIIAEYTHNDFDTKEVAAMTSLLVNATNRISEVFQDSTSIISSICSEDLTLYALEIHVKNKRFQLGILMKTTKTYNFWMRLRNRLNSSDKKTIKNESDLIKQVLEKYVR
ncbi:MAG: hypothetical protein K9W43_13195 [Candidatus Thorarchaeota archaeon]|nr:hypothetical protein [Candidatus Thorarchaeota archaeon]